MKPYIYVASSWRNPWQPAVVEHLKKYDYRVYDFRNPGSGLSGFSWAEIDPNWQGWTIDQYRNALKHPRSEEGFNADMIALKECDACILVQPAGTSSHLELGYVTGTGKPTAVLFPRGFQAHPMNGHSMHVEGACSGCGDLDGCHIPAKLKKIEPELMPKMCDAILGNQDELDSWLREGMVLRKS